MAAKRADDPMKANAKKFLRDPDVMRMN